MSNEFNEMSKSLGNGFEPPKPQLEFLYRLVAECAPPIEVGNVEKGFLKIIPITGGQFEGPRIKGVVLPVGADWNTGNHYNPAFKGIDTRYVLKTDDGAIISISTKGYVRQTDEIAVARAARQPVDPSKYYFKQHLFFETASEKYEWLNGVVAFGCVISKSTPGVIYDAYIVKQPVMSKLRIGASNDEKTGGCVVVEPLYKIWYDFPQTSLKNNLLYVFTSDPFAFARIT